jgi:hypothetical protein
MVFATYCSLLTAVQSQMIFGPSAALPSGLARSKGTGFGLPILDLLPSGASQRKRYATSETKRWLEQCLDLVGKCLVREVLWQARQKTERSNLATPPYQICCSSIESALKRCVLMPILP